MHAHAHVHVHVTCKRDSGAWRRERRIQVAPLITFYSFVLLVVRMPYTFITCQCRALVVVPLPPRWKTLVVTRGSVRHAGKNARAI